MRELAIGEVPAFAQRISYVGELGWELYGADRDGRARLGPAVGGRRRARTDRGRSRRVRLAPPEKGYRLWGQDITTEHDPFEAGLGFAVKMDKDFQGRDAPAPSGERGRAKPRVHDARRSRCRRDGQGADLGRRSRRELRHERELRLFDRPRRSPTATCPTELARAGTAVEIEYFGDRLAANVADEPLWTPRASACGSEDEGEELHR